MSDKDLLDALRMIADSLERIAPPAARSNDLGRGDAFVWQHEGGWLEPVATVSRVHINLLRGIDRSKDILLDNTRRFAKGFPANNALLWGARGTGKSSLVKAVHAQVNEEIADKLALIEIHREDLDQPAQAARHPQAPAAALHPVLRRPVVRRGRRQLQIAESGAGRRDRRTAFECSVLCHLQPPPSDAARDDRQRTLHRDQSVRSRRGEGLA